jgi:hypothetical protein
MRSDGGRVFFNDKVMLESGHSRLRRNYIHASVTHEYESVGSGGPRLAEVNLSGQQSGMQLHKVRRRLSVQ